MGVAAADSTALVAAGWLVHSVWTPLFPQLSYHTVLLLTPVLCHMRGLQITCCSVPQSPLHTNSGTPCLSLWGPSDTHRCPLPQGTGAVDMSCRMKGRDDLSFFHCSVSTCAATCIALSPRPLPPSLSQTAVIQLCWFKSNLFTSYYQAVSIIKLFKSCLSRWFFDYRPLCEVASYCITHALGFEVMTLNKRSTLGVRENLICVCVCVC